MSTLNSQHLLPGSDLQARSKLSFSNPSFQAPKPRGFISCLLISQLASCICLALALFPSRLLATRLGGPFHSLSSDWPQAECLLWSTQHKKRNLLKNFREFLSPRFCVKKELSVLVTISKLIQSHNYHRAPVPLIMPTDIGTQSSTLLELAGFWCISLSKNTWCFLRTIASIYQNKRKYSPNHVLKSSRRSHWLIDLYECLWYSFFG